MSLKFLRSLERVPQLELDEARSADRALNLAEGAEVLDVVRRRAGEIRVIPDVEEIRCKSEVLPFRQAEVLDQREIPILLERAAVDIAAERPEASSASRIGRVKIGAADSIRLRGTHEIVDVQIAIDAFVDVP